MWSKKAAAVAGGAIFLTLAGLIRLNYLFISAGLVMLTFVVISSFLDVWMPSVKIRRETSSDNIFEDGNMNVKFIVKNTGLGIGFVEIYDSLPPQARITKGSNYTLLYMRPWQEVSFEYSLKASYNGTQPGVAEENIQSRARGSIIMALSNKFNWLVLSTGNKTELAMGYCTLYGDMNGGLSVISDLSKTDVYALSRWVNESTGTERIPLNSIDKPPSAELKPNQIDPFDYDVVSPLVTALVDNQKSPSQLIKEGADLELVEDISRRIRINEYKRRQAAPGLRVTSKAFGMGRRVPIVNKYDELSHD